jgi:chromosome segregation ATPase
MKNKLVIWSKNAENEKVLVAIELLSDTSKVKVYTFPEAITDETFVQKMMNEWRDGKEEVVFPEGHETIERELSITESLLPEHLKVDRPDIIQRAQTEWQFALLSAKLHAAYQQELAEFKEKIEKLSAYDGKVFTSLRAFWDKVQTQSRERNLYRQHADDLRDGINTLFDQLKGMRDRLNAEFMDASQNVYDRFNKSLDEVEERIAAGGAKLNSVFEELKKMQREYHGARMSNEHRNQLWERIDAAFKKAKERKFGPDANAGTIAERTDRRLAGLEDAIKRLEESIRRDDEELAFQRKKVSATEGQLEAQIRSAKIKMIEERATGKRERLAELTKARADVQRQASSAQEREARAAAKEAERRQIEAKKAAIKSEIEAETHAKAAAAQTGQKEDSLFEAATNVLGDVLLDALDTARAVASVAAEKAEEVFEEVVERAEEALESLKKEEPAKEKEEVATNDAADKKEVADAPEQEGVIIDDVVHKTAPEAELESMAAADNIIIDDVVHKAKEDGEPEEKKEGDA